MAKVYFIGAGPGDADLITLKAVKAMAECDVIIYAGSLVSKDILKHAKKGADIYDSSSMNLEQTTEISINAVNNGRSVARLHTGDPSIYGAIVEQMIPLDGKGIEYEQIPGVSSLFAVTAALKMELTLPEISQTVIVTRYAGRTAVPEDFEKIAKAGGTLAIFLSVNMIGEITEKLIKYGRPNNTPVAVVYRASWADEKIVKGDLSNIKSKVEQADINKHAIIVIGDVVAKKTIANSKLYDAEFKHEYRK